MSSPINSTSNACNVSTSTACDSIEWDAFVDTHEQGSFFHRSGWGAAIRRAYGYDTHYITARREGTLVGVLALTDVRAPLLGRSLVSTAFSIGGGPLALDKVVSDGLLNAAATLGEALRVRHIECRSAFESEQWAVKSGSHETFSAPLLTDDEEALAAIPRKRRAEIRKAVQSDRDGDLSIRFDGTVDDFYPLYSASLHRLGTPVFPKQFIVELLNEFSDAFEISVAHKHGSPLAALVSFFYKDAVLPYYVGSSTNARESRAFDLIYWSAMRRAASRGYSKFNFGRSKIGSGAHKYKLLWGFEPSPVSYRIRPIAAKTIPDVSTANPKFEFFSRIWPTLPSVAVNRLGPLLAPNFP